MGTKIKSNNQGGSMAEQKVNWNSMYINQDKYPKRKNPWKVAISIVLVIATIVAVLVYFKIII